MSQLLPPVVIITWGCKALCLLASRCQECAELNISFHLLTGYAKDVLPEFVRMRGAGGVVTDFSPLRVPLQWVQDVKERLPRDVLLVQVPIDPTAGA